MVTGHLGHIFCLEMTQAHQRSIQVMFALSNAWLTCIGCLSNYLSNHYFHGPGAFKDFVCWQQGTYNSFSAQNHIGGQQRDTQWWNNI